MSSVYHLLIFFHLKKNTTVYLESLRSSLRGKKIKGLFQNPRLSRSGFLSLNWAFNQFLTFLLIDGYQEHGRSLCLHMVSEMFPVGNHHLSALLSLLCPLPHMSCKTLEHNHWVASLPSQRNSFSSCGLDC